MKFFIIAAALAAVACAQSGFQMRKAFDMLDADRDGKLQMDEGEAFFKKADTDNDGFVSPTEFIIAESPKGLSAKGALYIFYRADMNDDQQVTLEEHMNAAKHMDMDMDQEISFDEYEKVMNKVLADLAIAKSLEGKLKLMLAAADTDGDKELRGDEMWSVISPADKDGDKLVSMAEFTKYWRAKTGDNLDRSTKLFHMFDYDNDGFFGADAEKKSLYAGFDYGKDGSVSIDEFENSMLWMFAQVMEQVDMKSMKMAAITKAFSEGDTNSDGFISWDEYKKALMMIDIDMSHDVNATEYITVAVKEGMSHTSSLYMFFIMDMNNDEVVSHDEFKKAFMMYDLNQDRMISEYENHKNHAMLAGELAKVDAGEKKIGAMVKAADADSNGELTGDEMFAIVKGADQDVPANGISEKEFVTFFTKSTGIDAERSGRLFRNFDYENDGVFGSQDDKDHLYNAFDYDNSSSVSTTEFMNAMLWNYADVTKDMKMEKHMAFKNKTMGYFEQMDQNSDGNITVYEYTAAFNYMDTNGDGSLNMSEAITAFKIDANQTVWMFFRMDANEDQAVTAEEMLAINFYRFDYNNDDMMCAKEFMAMETFWHNDIMSGLEGAAITKKMAVKADADKDGELTKAEFDSVASGADIDDDGLDKAEFVEFWSQATGSPKMGSAALFDVFDGDKSGKIDDAESMSTYKYFDQDGSGAVSTDEFMYAMMFIHARIIRQMEMVMGQRVSFVGVDANNDTSISREEWRAAVAAYDQNGDGKFNATEFVTGYIDETGLPPRTALYVFFRLDANEDNLADSAEVDASFDAIDEDDDDLISMKEYSDSTTKLLEQMQAATVTGERLKAMFALGDQNNDGKLWRNETATVFGSADADKDGLVSEAEFTPFWQKATGEPKDRTDLFFGYLDSDSDGFYGNDNEREQLFDGFDYNDDDMVTEDEFLNSMLFLYARSIRSLEQQANMNVLGFFF